MGTPGNLTPPTFNCVEIEADVMIHKFDNRMAVGFVTNYDTNTNKGLFIGLYDNGNTDAVTVSTFDGSTGQLLSTVARHRRTVQECVRGLRRNELRVVRALLTLRIITGAGATPGPAPVCKRTPPVINCTPAECFSLPQ